MKNRYGDEYIFVKTGDNEYTIAGDLDHWRFGGRDLGFVDPSGGPFISIGYEINGRKVTNIAVNSEGIFFTVEAEDE